MKNRMKNIRHQWCYLQFETELMSYRDLSGLLYYIVIVFVYGIVKLCEI